MWKSYLFQMTTGRLGPQLDLSGGSWSVSLNATETAKFEFSKAGMPAVDYKLWLAPWWAGVLLTWNNVPIYGGPIIGQPYESRTALHVDCGGMRSILARRAVVKEIPDWVNLAKQPPVQFKGFSLGTIAKKVVQHVQLKPGGGLPISYPIPDEAVADDADHQRTYENYNLATTFCDDVLTKLSNVRNGPDIMFRPRFLDSQHITFDMLTGTEHNHRIRQTNAPTWDTTAVAGSVAEMQMTSTGSYQTDRVYAVGAGMNEGVLIAVAEDLSRASKGFPLLESHYPSMSENQPVVQAHADGNLNQNHKKLLEIQMTVRADGVYPLGSFWPGDLVQLVVKDWKAIPDGTHKARLLNMNGSLTNNTKDIRLSLQIEDDQ